MINRVTQDPGPDFLSPLTLSGDLYFLLLGDFISLQNCYIM